MGDKRSTSFLNSQRSVASKRVKAILNSPIDSVKLANAIRNLRDGKESKFKLTSATVVAINK